MLIFLTHVFGQSKIVKLNIDSAKIYLTYFYKSKYVSDCYLNDSVSYVGRKITENKFYLDKFVNKRKEWTKIYVIELAKDSLRITRRSTGKNGKSKFEYVREPYYNSFLVDK
jgi:hypothetical protein